MVKNFGGGKDLEQDAFPTPARFDLEVQPRDGSTFRNARTWFGHFSFVDGCGSGWTAGIAGRAPMASNASAR